MSLNPDIVDRLLDTDSGLCHEAAALIKALRKSYVEGLDAWKANSAFHAAEIERLTKALKKADK